MTHYDSQLGKLIASAQPAIEASQTAETLRPEEVQELLKSIQDGPQQVKPTIPPSSELLKNKASQALGQTGALRRTTAGEVA